MGLVPSILPHTLGCTCTLYTPTSFIRGRHGGVEKRGGWKTSRMTPLPKRSFGPPLVRYVFHPPQVSVLCFSCTKIHDRADQKLFWRGPKIFGRARALVRFPPPIRFAPPHITAQLYIYVYIYKREQRHFYANKANTGVHHFCMKHYKTRCSLVKRDRLLKSPRNSQHPERDRNEIRICII